MVSSDPSPDAAAAAAEAGAAGAAAAAGCERVLSLDIAATAHALGEANGVRHRDYRRYRLYLTRRLWRLRGQTDLKQGRHKYAAKPLPDCINDERWAGVAAFSCAAAAVSFRAVAVTAAAAAALSFAAAAALSFAAAASVSVAAAAAVSFLAAYAVALAAAAAALYPMLSSSAERAWSYGMQLKSDNASAPTQSAKLRAHSIRRFAKALRYARQLEALCKGQEPAAAAAAAAAGEAGEKTETPLCDGKTCLDAAAYRCSLEAVLQQEKEQWAAAAATLQQLQQLYMQLKRLSSTQPEREAFYRSKLAGLEPQLRLSLFHSGGVHAAAAKPQQQGTVSSSKAAAAAAADAASSSSQCIAIWRGAPVDPKTEKPRAAVLAALSNWREKQLLPVETLRLLAAAAAADMKSAAPALTDSDAQGWAEQYGDAAARFRGCVELIHKEMLANPEDSSWLHVEGYCLDMSRCLEVERDALMLLRCLLSLGSPDAKMRGTGELSAAHEGFRFASLLLQGLERMQGEETLPESRRAQLQRWIQAVKDGKATCLATAIACDGSLAEAFVLARAVSTRQVLRAPQAELRDDPHERIDLLSAAIQARGDTVFLAVRDLGKPQRLRLGSANADICAPF
ncbi:hypothetical protein Efla_005977 [Eimeria flavescens]